MNVSRNARAGALIPLATRLDPGAAALITSRLYRPIRRALPPLICDRPVAPPVHQLPPGKSLRLSQPGLGPGPAAPPVRAVGRFVRRCRHAPLIRRQAVAEDGYSAA